MLKKVLRKVAYTLSLVVLPSALGSFLGTFIDTGVSIKNNIYMESFFEKVSADVPPPPNTAGCCGEAAPADGGTCGPG